MYGRRWLLGFTAVLAFTATVGASAPRNASGSASTVDASRYPYDPACEWGRVADGRGMLVRCLTQAEAKRLISDAPPLPRKTDPAPTPEGPVAENEPSTSVPPDEAAPIRAKATVHPAVADSGQLPAAHKKLASARSRFEDCVNRHGGLRNGEAAEVHVRFLVRERGRAEGVSVGKRSGLSAAAASCVADVVDRRAVGVPDQPLVGATIVISFAPEQG